MKLVDEVSADKLRGGFYTPAPLVDACYRRIAEMLGTSRPLHILEPAAGDGAFLRCSAEEPLLARFREPTLTCVELIRQEADKCRQELRRAKVPGTVVNDSFFSWARNQTPVYDALVGNPPFVRYQFVSDVVRAPADSLLVKTGREIAGVANLWIVFTLVGLELLKNQGAFALVLPSELLSIMSAGLVRSELVRHFAELQVDIYPRGAFRGLLQDVIVVSGARDPETKSERPIRFREHSPSGIEEWSHTASDSKDAWTRYLLPARELAAFAAARQLPEVHALGTIATIAVSIVTGANDFFTVDDETLNAYELKPWAMPLLGRTAESRGIIFTKQDHAAARKRGKKGWVLDFSADAPDPMQFSKPRQYLRLGEGMELPKRFKCRIREPWYRIPVVRHGELLLPKRSHQFHRFILNTAGACTTDTIYRGKMKPLFAAWKRSLVAGFHNSLTILSCELEGRSYGGGVLELVPSEIAQLCVPLVDIADQLPQLDRVCRNSGGQLDSGDTLISATDDLLRRAFPGLKSLLPDLASARLRLRGRRFHGGCATGPNLASLSES